MKPTLPYTPGADAAGIVNLVGEGVTEVKPGDRIYTSGSLTGTYAEQTLCTKAQVHPLPANVIFEQGAALGVPYSTAYRALFQRGGGKKGEEVLIHGASGGVGTAAVQLARAAGMLVTGTAGTDAGMKLVTEQGAQHAVNHATAGYLDELMQLTGGRGFDLIIEMLANKNLQNDLGLLAKKGRVVVVGNRGMIEINPRDAMSREANIRGMTLSAASEAELREIHAALGTGLENGTLHPVIGTKIPLAEAPRAHEEIMKSSGALGKTVLTVG
jgi:NADPH2:quinone reductase